MRSRSSTSADEGYTDQAAGISTMDTPPPPQDDDDENDLGSLHYDDAHFERWSLSCSRDQELLGLKRESSSLHRLGALGVISGNNQKRVSEEEEDDQEEDIISCSSSSSSSISSISSSSSVQSKICTVEEEHLLGYKSLICLLGLLLLIAGALAAAIPLSNTNINTGDHPVDTTLQHEQLKDNPSVTPSHHQHQQPPAVVQSHQSTTNQIFYPPFVQHGLAKETVQDILEDPSSPAFKANAWMWHHPSLELNDDNKWKRQQQRFGLVALYYALNGDTWYNNTGWLDHQVGECDWFHHDIVCNDEGFILYSNLTNNNLTGTIPLEIKHITTLRRMDWGYNTIQDTLDAIKPLIWPTRGGEPMQTLVLSHNQLHGKLLTSEMLGYQPDLKILKLDGNRFAGDLTNDIFSHVYLPSLQVLNLTDNFFQGTIPLPDANNPSHLTYLGLANNLLEGTMPTQLGRLKQLTSLSLANNLLEGSIPTQLGLLTSLQELDLSNNEFLTGMLPQETLAALNQTLVKLDVSGSTSLQGSIPQILCQRQQEGKLSIKATCDASLECCFT